MSDESEAGRTRGDHLQGFAVWLGQAGYAAFTIRSKVRFASQFLRSLEAAGVRVQDLDEDRIDAAVAQKRRSAIDRHKALLQFIDHLRERGIAPRQFERSDESPVAPTRAQVSAPPPGRARPRRRDVVQLPELRVGLIRFRGQVD